MAKIAQLCAVDFTFCHFLLPLMEWLAAPSGGRVLLGLATRIRLLGYREDKSFHVAEMARRLGVTPRSFAEGLALKIEPNRF